tara:strand:+ start:504 stop:833 length:330 start_codon:yes stop_codon:yes gene_type:complete
MKIRSVGGSTNINSSVSAGAQTSAGIETKTAIEENDYRKSFTITNMATTKLYVKLGASCTSSSFHFVLPPCGAEDDGTGGSLSVDGFKGSVSIASGGSGGGRYTAVEFI